ncbi:inner membrane-spanning protein YciB [Roseisalinus antarcticus]|uniref:Inner membrane-spanning protein YciB n=1 Tax=Roseisalinus antarcticus TaxID=254357 RepID=A0A1Y5TRD7_9RHOB|nr:inner membrane-spanning protein YciB [Roseisalinus antarcticus]SLN66451.1 putative intracellular septation protein A [Roseisalinus antarcticus]
MSDRPINPVLKQVLELGPTIVFFLAYLRLRDETFTIGGVEYSGFIVATLVFIPVLLAAIGVLWALTRKLSRMQIFTAFMVIFFGGLTAWFNDERFFKIKTTIVYGVMAALLGLGLLRRQSWLEWVIGELMPMQHEGWMVLTRRLAAFLVVLALANELIWRTQSTDLWVKLETFAFPVALIAFLWWQIFALQKYLIEPPDATSPTDKADS